MPHASNRRKDVRQRVLKAGRIVFNHRSSVIDCTVRNLSAHGGCLEVASTTGIPDAFDLLLDDGARAHHCTVRWRSMRRIGVTFA
jgi:PilZ domain